MSSTANIASMITSSTTANGSVIYKVCLVDSRTHATYTSRHPLRFKNFRVIAEKAGTYGCFPPTFAKSKYGKKLTDPELEERLAGLNGWVREVVVMLSAARLSTDDDMSTIALKNLVGFNEVQSRARRNSKAGRTLCNAAKTRFGAKGEADERLSSAQVATKRAGGFAGLMSMINPGLMRHMKTTQ